MPAERVAMRVVREVLRLTFAGVSKREVARRTGLASSTVRATIARFQSLGLIWPLPETITDSDLEAKIYKSAGKKQGHRRIIEPDWASLHREMKRKHVTLSILWDEYIELTRRGIATAGSASFTGPGKAKSPSRCGRPIWAAISCSSITLATRLRW